MQLRVSKRSQARIRIAMQGPSGSGKTYSSLLLAFGLVGDWSKVAVIDTENQSADLYAHLGGYNVISLGAPYTPEKYLEAIQLCETAGMEAIVIDSLSHEWETLLDVHSNMPGNSFSNWGKITPRHNHLINKILSSTSHIIATVRSKQDYVLTEKNGKQVPEKVGLKGVQRDGLEYDFTIVFEVNIKHFVTASKDRTGMFVGLPDFRITAETGEMIRDWCQSSASNLDEEPSDFVELINSCKSLDQLYKLYNENPGLRELYKEEFVARKSQLLTKPNFMSNGTHAN
ncbi:Putative bacteriophage protein [Indibacter alkaliphilus LW1]|uniref:Bacteriophage protein n=1 Tax=Indibacter alkaliphilus (strain CCUG 57479 / KCTC 22604 / LW1) TaxID=1189612 RepID=S2DM27_INDAL|nr:AAA family ATPase [Indibacter alkaliphilus]EPA00018.1 Putative bacteriophage protein [Indibacter alkaliphilus LW1]